MLGVNGESLAKDIGEFGAIAILAPDNLFFILVVIARGQELSKDEFGNVASLGGMQFNGNAVAVIFDTKGSSEDRNVHMPNRLAAFCGGGSDKGISRIHQDLVKEFVEPGVHLNRFPEHLVAGRVVDPSLFGAGGGGSDIRVGELEDVFLVAQEFIGFERLGSGCHGTCWRGGP